MPAWITPQLITSVLVILLLVHVLLGASAYLILLERKISAWAAGSRRSEPRRTAGVAPADRRRAEALHQGGLPSAGRGPDAVHPAPGMTAIAALIGFAVIPWGGSSTCTRFRCQGARTASLPDSERFVKVLAADVNIGVIYLIAVGSLGVYGVVLGGWASNNKFAFLGGLRAAAQMVSYEIPAGALAALRDPHGGHDPSRSILVQQQLEGQWYLVQQPLAAIIFYVCMLAEANRAPFDLAEAEAELVGGWHTEYSSMKWALFFLGEYIHLFVGSAFFAVLFLGGWSLNPLSGWDLPVGGRTRPHPAAVRHRVRQGLPSRLPYHDGALDAPAFPLRSAHASRVGGHDSRHAWCCCSSRASSSSWAGGA